MKKPTQTNLKADQKKKSKKGKKEKKKAQKPRAKSVTKADLVKTTAELRSAIVPETALFVDAFLEALMAELVHGNDVLITGFGKFILKERPERKRKNPYKYVENPEVSNEEATVVVDADRTVTFRVSSKFKQRLNWDQDGFSEEED